MPIEQAAKVVSNMDSDDAMDLFEELNEEDKYKLLKRLDKEAKEDVTDRLDWIAFKKMFRNCCLTRKIRSVVV